jgi:predicted nucleic acid-binding protein
VKGGFLLDTNVISATAPDRMSVPELAKAAARSWIVNNQNRLYLPVTAIAEIAGGIGTREVAGASRQAADLAPGFEASLALIPIGFSL